MAHAGHRVGLWHWKNKLRAKFSDQSLSDSRDGTDAIYGQGLESKFSKRWAVGAEASRCRANGDYADLLGANIQSLG